MRRCRTRRASSALWIASLASRTRQRSARRRRWSLATWSPRRQPWRCCHTRLLTVGSSRPLRLGTRGSRLALVQSEIVAARLRASGAPVEVRTILSEGDVRAKDAPIGEGIFVTALERALVAGEIDIAVHSAKDLPLEDDPNLVIAAYPERADARDALVTRLAERSIDDLAVGARVGTDSPRRAGFLRALRPDLDVIPLHGNVDTRLRRLDAGEADAIVIAAAGLERLGFGNRIAARLDFALMPPAPGQGALAVQARRDDQHVLA